MVFVFFFFQAEDGIRDHCVTGVQTCALPICVFLYGLSVGAFGFLGRQYLERTNGTRNYVVAMPEIGRASCRERVQLLDAAVLLYEKSVGAVGFYERQDQERENGTRNCVVVLA